MPADGCAIYVRDALVEGKLEAPKHLARTVHDLYFEPTYERVPARYDLERVECVYVDLQGTGADPSISGDCQAGRISENQVLTVVLTSPGRLPG